MGNQELIADIVKKFGQYLFNRGGIRHHFICNRGQPCDFLGDRLFWMHKGSVARDNLALPNGDGTDFDNLAGGIGKARCFKVKDHHFIPKGRTGRAVEGTRHIVDKIRLHAVKHLEVASLFLAQLLQCQHDLGKALHIAVVGNGNGLVSPACRRLNDLGGRNQGIHCRHIGMQMKLNTLFV